MTHVARAVVTTDEQRRRGLRQMRSVALGLLLLAALIYVLTLHHGGVWGYVHAAAEASMVGAIADWFAVTALFRHPLGLPIPHTALIPTRKLMLARSLQDFVTENFLSDDVVRARVADAQVSHRVASWVSEDAHSEQVIDEVSVVVRAALQRIDNEEVRKIVEAELLPRIAEEPLSVLAGQLLQEVLDRRRPPRPGRPGGQRGAFLAGRQPRHGGEHPERASALVDAAVARRQGGQAAASRGRRLGRGDPRRPGPPGATRPSMTCSCSCRRTCRPTPPRSSGRRG